MEELKSQVHRAQRTLILEQFLKAFGWCLLVGLLVAAIGVAVPKFWPLAVDANVWFWSWVGGSAAASLLAAIGWTWVVRRGELEAAWEIDRRFGLKERVASSLSLAPEELETEAGRALVTDASQRVARLEISEKFSVEPPWHAALPVVPLVLIVAFTLLLNNAEPAPASAAVDPLAQKKAIKKNTEELKKKLAEARKKAELEKLPEAEALLTRLEQGIERSFREEKADVKQAMSTLNDLAKEIRERRDDVAAQDRLRQQLNQLRDLKRGPADKLGQAMKQGDFNKALEEIKNLQEQLKNDKLDPEQQKQLGEQLKQMQEKLKGLADAHEQAKRDLEEQIKQQLQAGDREAAGKLQQQLDKLNQQNQAMQQMQQLADQLGQAAQQLKEGNQQGAAQQMEQLAENLQQLQRQEQELQTLNEALDQLADAKQKMGCDACQGDGCQACDGDMPGGGKPKNGGKNGQASTGPGIGTGRGPGLGPEREEDRVRFYESKVAAKVQKGASVVTGTAGGANIAGEAREELRGEFVDAPQESTATVSDKPIPRAAREHAREYLERFRKGE